MLILERPWTRQPQTVQRLNINNQFAAAAGFVIHPGAGAFEYKQQQTPSVNSATINPTPAGKALTYSSSANTRFTNAHAKFATAGPMTFAALIDVDALSSFSGIAACQSTATTNGWELRLGVGSTDSRLFWLRAGPSGYQTCSGSAGNTITAGAKSVFVAVTHNASSTTDPTPTFIVNDTSYTGSTITGTGGAYAETTSDLWLGRRYDGATQLAGKIHWAYFAPKSLTFSDLQLLRREFYGQLFAPQQIIIPTPAAAASAPTITALSARLITATSAQPRISYS